MMAEDLRFNEVEHKYIVDERFDVQRFRGVVATLCPTRMASIRVRDRYYLTEASRARRFVIRHRYDGELQHLTVKTLDADTEVRVEVNLDLGHHAGDQHAQVDAFLSQLGVEWSGTLHKELEVWDFADCEVVYYQASSARRSVACVEFEATRKDSLTAALAIVEKYERATGFDRAQRSHRPLLEIMFPEVVALLARATSS
jgi:hypothetical protein